MAKNASSKTTTVAAAAATDENLVRVYHLNRSKGAFLHGEYRLDPGSSSVVPKDVADLWISHTDGTGKPHVALSEAEIQKPDPEKVKLVQENDALAAQIKGLEAQLAAAQAAAKPTE